MSGPPERFKPLREMSAHDFLELQQTGQRPESDAYREYRARTLEAAGLPADDAGPKPLGDMTVADHLARIQRRR